MLVLHYKETCFSITTALWNVMQRSRVDACFGGICCLLLHCTNLSHAWSLMIWGLGIWEAQDQGNKLIISFPLPLKAGHVWGQSTCFYVLITFIGYPLSILCFHPLGSLFTPNVAPACWPTELHVVTFQNIAMVTAVVTPNLTICCLCFQVSCQCESYAIPSSRQVRDFWLKLNIEVFGQFRICQAAGHLLVTSLVTTTAW
jgi:hypothetical protein